ncbi:hypothetical protein [Flavobacterium sp.]|uniref:hypothetical protein n=1 Tax=Flavobacterium sp. TaxID=239 RepID=UPI00121FBA07|nr:hypothetical protein [Flavobacterium sp.]RZJ72872.1 MAG: hypothetical protein EOO49_04355 [Flavobacterium sp.]
MKKVVLFLLAIFFASCSDDDSGTKVKLVRRLVVSSQENPDFNYTYTFKYDKSGRLTRYDSDYANGPDWVMISYNSNNTISRIEQSKNGQINLVEMTYLDEILSQFTKNGVVYQVSYNESTQTYTAGQNSFSLNANGDCTALPLLSFGFEPSRFGPFYNAPVSPHRLDFFISDSNILFFATRIPVRTIQYGSLSIPLENTYDSEGFLKTSDFVAEFDVHYELTY